MTEKMKNVVLTASSCAHGRRVARLSELSAPSFRSATTRYCRLAPGLKELNLLSARPAAIGEQHGDHTRPSAPTVRSCLIELLIRSRPSSVGSVSQIGGQYPLCALLGHFKYITTDYCNSM